MQIEEIVTSSYASFLWLGAKEIAAHRLACPLESHGRWM
jgi:hypothetical protein